MRRPLGFAKVEMKNAAQFVRVDLSQVLFDVDRDAGRAECARFHLILADGH